MAVSSIGDRRIKAAPSPLVWWPQTRPAMDVDVARLLVALLVGTPK